MLDAADGGRLATAADVLQAFATRSQARTLLDQGDFGQAKALLEPLYQTAGLPREVRQPIVADLAWAGHRLAEFDAARELYVEFLLSPLVSTSSRRDALQRLREVRMGLAPGPIESSVTQDNLP